MLTPDDHAPSELHQPKAWPGHAGDKQELDLGIVATGNVEVDESLAGLSDLDQIPVEQHPGVYEDVHAHLATELSKFDEVEADSESDVEP